MEYDKARKIPDFVARTLSNLEIIEGVARDQQEHGVASGAIRAFEFTQLWNSLLGVVVIPREADLQSRKGRARDADYFELPDRTGKVAELWKDRWPAITKKPFREPATYGELLDKIRHAVSHYNVRFVSDFRGEIVKVSMWNTLTPTDANPKPRVTWAGEISVEQLRDLTWLIASTYKIVAEEAAA